MHAANLLPNLDLFLAFSDRASGYGKSDGTASVGACHHMGYGQLVAVLQIPVSWMLACDVCQEQGVCISSYLMNKKE